MTTTNNIIRTMYSFITDYCFFGKFESHTMNIYQCVLLYISQSNYSQHYSFCWFLWVQVKGFVYWEL